LYYGGHIIGEEDQDDVYVAEYEDGRYVRRVRLAEPISSGNYENTPFVAPDESYLIFSRVVPQGNHADLFICLREGDDSWSDPINMASINTHSEELAPNVTRDGKYLFFMSFRSGAAKPYWVSADVLDAYR